MSDNYDATENESLEVTDDEVQALKDEIEILHEGDTRDAAQQLLVDKTIPAILAISKLATEANAERVRLDASKYIVERVLGPLKNIMPDVDPDTDPMVKFMKKAGLIKTD